MGDLNLWDAQEGKLTSLNWQSLQGLRVIKTVLDLKGAKKFKKYNFGPEASTIDDLNIDEMNIN